ncbi:hypothetical protein ASG52_08540 [Methylobacterium sp. Leaf456]|uniref:hypothetical protein n=1 Tax=Methylobacterium sp. Leaf456 TaxID=1736382 RepID=UPI0006F449ED|nr:hypothetical protein [Methylobacterium sp. Leaf456]KQT50102.1 hypothetical protein ASG52_08540 [Methylobacterium sp. Leaf456]
MPAPVAHPEPTTWRLPGALLAASLTASVWLGLPSAKAGEPVAAIFPPWWSSAERVAAAVAAGGAVLRAGPGLVIAQSSAPGFEARLHAAGAWLLFDPRGLGLCTPAGTRRP